MCTAGCTGLVRIIDVERPDAPSTLGRVRQLAVVVSVCFDRLMILNLQHDLPVRACYHIPATNCIATGSWDRSIKVWDERSPEPAFQQLVRTDARTRPMIPKKLKM